MPLRYTLTAEQSRAEQSRAEQSRAEQSRALLCPFVLSKIMQTTPVGFIRNDAFTA